MCPSCTCKAKPVTYVVKWPKMAGLLDGEYVEAGTRNAKPMYKQRNGPGAIWHESALGATRHGSFEECTGTAQGVSRLEAGRNPKPLNPNGLRALGFLGG